MPVALTPHHGQVPFIDYEEGYIYMPASLMPRKDIMQETKLCFAMITTEYMPLGFEVAQNALVNITIEDIVKKYKQPLLMAGTIQNEIKRLAPDLHSIMTGKPKK